MCEQHVGVYTFILQVRPAEVNEISVSVFIVYVGLSVCVYVGVCCVQV